MTLCSALCSLCRLCPERMGNPSWRESSLPVKGHQQGAVHGQIQCHLVSAFSACGIFPPRSVPLELLSRFHGNHSPLERSRACVHSLFPCVSAPQHREGPTECHCHNRYRKAAQLPLLLHYPRPHRRPSAQDGGAGPCLPEMGVTWQRARGSLVRSQGREGEQSDACWAPSLRRARTCYPCHHPVTPPHVMARWRCYSPMHGDKLNLEECGLAMSPSDEN